MSLDFTAHVPARDFNVRFSLATGETVALMGPNGAGKSTLLSVLAGLLRPDCGSATLDGKTLYDDGEWLAPHTRGIVLLAQDALLFPHLSVLENVAFGPRCAGVPRSAARKEAHRWLREVDAADLAHRRPVSLSGGQAQRVAVARALAAEPALLLLDEPLAALDISVAPMVRRMLRRVLEGRSAIIVTHDIVDALLLADRVVIVDGGRIVEDGPTRLVLERPRSSFAAGLAGVNLMTGTTTRDGLRTPGGVQLAALQDRDLPAGEEAAAVFSPRAVAVHRLRPTGSPRNVLAVTITDLEQHGGRTTVRADHLSAEITTASAAELDLLPGAEVYFSVKSAEVEIYLR
ncbi:molybdenum ABC transporter ATP-binding protein [Arthrobacter sp. Soil782]|uniref:sulfate/molybdate ABC transporter ATP-binding protein n=1 Tax=Arthrobacter sp. Soil782 TaxID=1736410 RepID=UPI0006F3CD5B|nr:ATP-binding cassette domain-containing protein [Arthrobacter sp. Soil782]KRF05792.1 molybdenum ABC transporter ATP-binding protein [Arthrobacter sp. Soil782]